ncbi:hypothetical protein GCM10027597_27900 [Saccharopolyspora tripterygii]
MTALSEIDDRLFKTEAIRDSPPVRTGKLKTADYVEWAPPVEPRHHTRTVVRVLVCCTCLSGTERID